MNREKIHWTGKVQVLNRQVARPQTASGLHVDHLGNSLLPRISTDRQTAWLTFPARTKCKIVTGAKDDTYLVGTVPKIGFEWDAEEPTQNSNLFEDWKTRKLMTS
jgi:hypothetical protein